MNYQYLFPQPNPVYYANKKETGDFNDAGDRELLMASNTPIDDNDQSPNKHIIDLNVDEYTSESRLKVMFHKSEKIIVSLLLMTFQIFVIYSLVISNTDSIREKCGDSLWKFVLSRLIIGSLEFIIFIALGFVQMSILKYYFKPNNDTSSNSAVEFSMWFSMFTLLIFIGIHATLLALGVIIVTPVMESTTCTAALSSVSTTDTPLMAILTYVYIAGDALILVSVLCGCCMGCLTTTIPY
jgi:hypothetical protein